METAAGRWRLACSMSNSTLFPAASPTMRTLPGRSSATLRVLTPMEPVLPRRTTDLIWDLRFTIYDLRFTRRGIDGRFSKRGHDDGQEFVAFGDQVVGLPRSKRFPACHREGC